jgi:hypothetical protein
MDSFYAAQLGITRLPIGSLLAYDLAMTNPTLAAIFAAILAVIASTAAAEPIIVIALRHH